MHSRRYGIGGMFRNGQNNMYNINGFFNNRNYRQRDDDFDDNRYNRRRGHGGYNDGFGNFGENNWFNDRWYSNNNRLDRNRGNNVYNNRINIYNDRQYSRQNGFMSTGMDGYQGSLDAPNNLNFNRGGFSGNALRGNKLDGWHGSSGSGMHNQHGADNRLHGNYRDMSGPNYNTLDSHQGSSGHVDIKNLYSHGPFKGWSSVPL